MSSKGLRERAATFAERDAPWFNRLAALESAEAGARVAQQPILAQYSAALSAIARERPLVLILEDMHWVDSASSGLLFHLSREAAHSRMLILGTYRPDEVAVSRGEMAHPLAEMLSELKRWHGDIWLDLGELAEADGRRFVGAYLDTRPNRLGPAFREALFNRTGGHALFTVELVREMRERGDMRQDAEGQWIDGPAINWNTLPARVEGVIEKRIQRLEKELRSILTIASVEGETFTAEVLARVQQVQERRLVEQLSRELEKRHRLITAHILAWLGSQRLSLYRFRHQLFQQYVYHSLTEMERVYLHEGEPRRSSPFCMGAKYSILSGGSLRPPFNWQKSSSSWPSTSTTRRSSWLIGPWATAFFWASWFQPERISSRLRRCTTQSSTAP
ncbi:MAG: ATP-binding protein [Roseiflexaceae bacterium]